VKIVKSGGSIFITTQNRTLASWLVVIVAAEYIFRRVWYSWMEQIYRSIRSSTYIGWL